MGTRALILFGMLTTFGRMTSALPTCGASDYQQVFQPCDKATNTRRGTLQKRPGAICRDPISPPIEFQSSCECTVDDYFTDILECPADGGTTDYRPFQHRRINDCTGGLQVTLSSLSAPCPCTNLQTTYTGCINNLTRYLVYFYEDNCTPSPTQPLPPPVKVPCDLYCSSGSYLGFDRRQCPGSDIRECPVACVKCDAGAFSFAGDLYTDFSKWPDAWETGCEGSWWSTCSSWQALPDSLWSGDQKRGDNIVAWLSTHVIIINPEDAYLQFDYRVESEKTHISRTNEWVGDRLILEVNGTEVQFSNETFVGGMMYTFQTSWRVPLPVCDFGPTRIKFIYRKDTGATQYGDAVWLKNIRISGTKPFVTKCDLCPAGTYQDDAQSNSCDPCPENTYSADEGRTACTPCDSKTEWAPAGATACLTKKSCTRDEDFIPIRNCVDQREVTSFKQVNPNCALTAPITDETKEVCAPCPAGTVPDDASLRRCIPCKSGMYAQIGSTECQQCPAGTFGEKSIKYEDFGLMSGNIGLGFYGEQWSTSCQGLCASSQGWGLAPFHDEAGIITVLNSGKNHGKRYTSIISINVTLNHTGSVAFIYSIEASGSIDYNHSALLTFHIYQDGDETPKELPLSTAPQTFETSLQQTGRYELTWSFSVTETKKAEAFQLSCNVWGLRIVGASEGSVSECKECPSSHYCPPGTDHPIPCPVGTYSESGAAECVSCPAELVAIPGTHECRPCSVGSLAMGDFCRPSCSLELPFEGQLVQYDLSSLSYSLRAVTPDECEWSSESEECNWDYMYDVQFCASGDDQTQNDMCANQDGGPELAHAFACQTNSYRGRTWVIGTNRSAVINNSPQRWLVEYDGGKHCSSVGYSRRTRIIMICDPDGSVEDPKFVQRGESPNCVYNFEFIGPQACPLCTEESFHVEQTGCKNGTRITRYHRLENCSSAAFKDHEEACPLCDYLTYEICDSKFRRWRRTVYLTNASCWAPIGDEGEEDTVIGHCAQVNVDEANRFTIALAGLLGLFFVVMLCAVFVCLKHRQLQLAYQQLSRRRRAREMTAMPFLSTAAADDIFGEDSEEDFNMPAAGHAEGGAHSSSAGNGP